MTSQQPPESGRISPWSLRALAVHGPLALFASGILLWVDGLAGQPGGGVLRVAARVLLVAGVLCLVGVAVVLLRDRCRLGAASWLLVGAGVALTAVTRELLPVAALLVLIGLAPLGVAEVEWEAPEPTLAERGSLRSRQMARTRPAWTPRRMRSRRRQGRLRPDPSGDAR